MLLKRSIGEQKKLRNKNLVTEMKSLTEGLDNKEGEISESRE